MSSDVTCEKLREVGAELALGVLPGRERAAAVAHLDRCADCREYIEQLTLVGDGLIGLLPGSEPPGGFETRVTQALTQAAPAREGRSQARGSGIPRMGLGSRVRLRAVSAAAALVLAVGFGGWAVGTVIQEATVGSSRSTENQAGLLEGELTSAQAPKRPTGDIYAHPGSPGWIYMSVNLAAAGTPYSGKVSCILERSDGTRVRVGTFTVHEGYGFWGGPASVDASTLSGARLTSPDGTVLATAHFDTDAPT
ncbi:anti-sigma factor family protein [Streptomyces sp. NPDC058321]|uniref:anti-sigma factor family protein n=1 Tax=Streptomyces sp. NPDC058321 TaxID=3346445 RepID=UPI0036E3FFD7